MKSVRGWDRENKMSDETRGKHSIHREAPDATWPEIKSIECAILFECFTLRICTLNSSTCKFVSWMSHRSSHLWFDQKNNQLLPWLAQRSYRRQVGAKRRQDFSADDWTIALAFLISCLSTSSITRHYYIYYYYHYHYHRSHSWTEWLRLLTTMLWIQTFNCK